MKMQGVAFRTAAICFGTWLLLALLIADFPPPPGFLFVALILPVCESRPLRGILMVGPSTAEDG
jgi:hypothetical protein